MNRSAKLLANMRSNPQGDWDIDDVKRLCRVYGVQCKKPGSGSHYKVSSPKLEVILTIPAHRPIKAVYIRELVKFLDKVGEASA
jgi:hypothetical protein